MPQVTAQDLVRFLQSHGSKKIDNLAAILRFGTTHEGCPSRFRSTRLRYRPWACSQDSEGCGVLSGRLHEEVTEWPAPGASWLLGEFSDQVAQFWQDELFHRQADGMFGTGD